jgi:hypothetical protein
MFFQPVTIEKGGSSFVFEDAGSSRVNNPTSLAYEELTNHPLFKNRKVGCIISFGTGKHSFCSVVSDDSQGRLRQLVSDLAKQAEDTEAIHQTVARKPILLVKKSLRLLTLRQRWHLFSIQSRDWRPFKSRRLDDGRRSRSGLAKLRG